MTETSRAYRETIWYFDPGHVLAIRPGSFVEQLIRAMAYADPANLRKLARVFPSYAAAVETLKTQPNGYKVAGAVIWEEEEGDE